MTKVIFKVPTKCTGGYQNSPFYKGTLLWNFLDVELQKAPNVNTFMNGLKKLYVNYQEIW